MGFVLLSGFFGVPGISWADQSYGIRLNYSALPALLNYRKLTLTNVAVGTGFSSVTVAAPVSVTHITYNAGTGMASFTVADPGTGVTQMSVTVTAVGAGTMGAGTAAKANLYNNFKWALSQTFDDEYESAWLFGKPVLDAHTDVDGNKWRAGIAFVTSFIGANFGADPTLPGGQEHLMTAAELQSARTAGWDIFNHTHDHPNGGMTCANFQTEFDQNQSTAVTLFPGYKLNHIVYPYEVGTAISCAGFPTTYLYSGEISGASYNFVDVAVPGGFTGNPAGNIYAASRTYLSFPRSLATWQTVADGAAANARNTWLINITHRVYPTTAVGNDNQYSTNASTLGSYYTYLDGKYGTAGGNNSMWFAPSGEVQDYLFTRDKVTLSYFSVGAGATATPSATPTRTATATATRTATSSPTATVTATRTNTPTSTASSTPSSTRSNTPSATPSNSPTATASATRTNTPSATMTRTTTSSATSTASATSSMSATATPTASRTSTPTMTSSPTDTAVITPTTTRTPTVTASTTPTSSSTLTATSSASPSKTPTSTTSSTPSATASFTPSSTPSATPTVTLSPTDTPPITPTPTRTPTVTASTTPTSTASSTSSVTPSATPTLTPSNTATSTASSTRTSTMTATPSLTATASPTPTATNTFTRTATLTATSTPTSSWTATFTATASMTPTASLTPTPSASPTKTLSATSTPVGNPTVILYPNPAPGPTVNILPPVYGGTQDVRVLIFTASFRKVNDVTFPSVPSGMAVTMDLRDFRGHSLANGLYYVVVLIDGHRSVSRLMVLR